MKDKVACKNTAVTMFFKKKSMFNLSNMVSVKSESTHEQLGCAPTYTQ